MTEVRMIIRYLEGPSFSGEEGWYFGTEDVEGDMGKVGPYATLDETVSDLPEGIPSVTIYLRNIGNAPL